MTTNAQERGERLERRTSNWNNSPKEPQHDLDQLTSAPTSRQGNQSLGTAHEEGPRMGAFKEPHGHDSDLLSTAPTSRQGNRSPGTAREGGPRTSEPAAQSEPVESTAYAQGEDGRLERRTSDWNNSFKELQRHESDLPSRTPTSRRYRSLGTGHEMGTWMDEDPAAQSGLAGLSVTGDGGRGDPDITPYTRKFNRLGTADTSSTMTKMVDLGGTRSSIEAGCNNGVFRGVRESLPHSDPMNQSPSKGGTFDITSASDTSQSDASTRSFTTLSTLQGEHLDHSLPPGAQSSGHRAGGTGTNFGIQIRGTGCPGHGLR